MARVPERFHSLDVLRGLAALSVVFWHWPHFFYSGSQRPALAMERLPLFELFFPLYSVGGLGVEMFFSLSGFIFYWLYARAVAASAVSGRDFFILRFSRLYPLHLATLLAVAFGQAAYFHMANTHFVYALNDSYHFALNVLFAFSWGLEKAYSFNGPAWSVSVEVALYLLFFVLCRLLPVRAVVLAGAAAAGLIVREAAYPPLGEGLFCFFAGGLAYLAYERIVASGHTDPAAKWLTGLVSAMWIGGIAAVAMDWGERLSARTWQILYMYPTALLFPLTILTLALVETRRGTLGRRFAWLGDISYSSYLLHFPLQLAVVLAAAALGLDRSIFFSPYVLIAFLALLLAFSLASFRYFEAPLQRALRRQWLTRGLYNARLKTS